MKRLMLSAAIAALLTGSLASVSARGQNASPQNATPPTSEPPTTAPAARWLVELAQAANSAPPVQSKPVTYLGVSLEAPAEPLRAQLQLQDTVGLLVTWVDEQGPARDVLAKHDVITRLDDQIVVNAEQFQALVRMHKPGDVLELRLVRNAKPLQVSVKLAEKNAAATEFINWANTRLDKAVSSQFPYPLRDVSGSVTALDGAGPIYILSSSPGQAVAWPVTQPSVSQIYQQIDQSVKLDAVTADKLDASTDRATIARRLYLDVTGLPASDVQIKTFVDDQSPNAYEKLVQELLKNRPVVIQPEAVKGYVLSNNAVTHTSPIRNVVMTDGIYRLRFDTDGTALLTIMDKRTGAITSQAVVQKPEEWKALPEGARVELDTWLRTIQNWRQSVVEDANQVKQEGPK